MTPPKTFKHVAVNLDGRWVCNRCGGESPSMDKLIHMPCNPALIQKMNQLEPR